jgi:NMD protein affecting ribosome stability and mRNA decay
MTDTTSKLLAARAVISELRAENERLEAVLRYIARNTCCDHCQEAALVARAALEPKP